MSDDVLASVGVELIKAVKGLRDEVHVLNENAEGLTNALARALATANAPLPNVPAPGKTGGGTMPGLREVAR